MEVWEPPAPDSIRQIRSCSDFGAGCPSLAAAMLGHVAP
jgi:hypothetical protein